MSSAYNKSNTSTRVTTDKKTFTAAPTPVQQAGMQDSKILQKVPNQQLQKGQQQILEQEQQQVLTGLSEKIKQFEEQLNELKRENKQLCQQLDNQIKQQDEKLQQQEYKIKQQDEKLQQQEYKIKQQDEKLQQQEYKTKQQDQKIQQYDSRIKQQEDRILQLEQKLESQTQNQERNDIQKEIQNFIYKNHLAHETWKMSSEKIQKACGIIEQQHQELDLYKQQIAEKVNEYNNNIICLVKEELKQFTEQLNQTNQMAFHNSTNLSNYEEILRKYCDEINKCLNLYGFQRQNYSDNTFQPQQQYTQQIDQSKQYTLIDSQLQFQQQQYPQQNTFFNSQFQQPNFITPQDQTSQVQFLPNYQDPNIQLPKSKIRLVSSSQGQTTQ